MLTFLLRRTLKTTQKLFKISMIISRNKTNIDFNDIKYPTKVPLQPYNNDNIKKSEIIATDKSTKTIEIDEKTIQLLERLSMVDISNKDALKVLKDSIEFVSPIIDTIDVTNIEPLYTVLDCNVLELREDEITDGNIQEDILKNAKLTEEEYFVAPPGNIPLEITEKKF